MKYDVYLAAPFFCDAERSLNAALVEILEADSISVFYPFRDGILAKKEIANGRLINEVMSEVWSCDTKSIQNSKIILAVLDGRAIDEGVCVEIGYAAALSKKIVGYSSDSRLCFPWGFNPMVSVPVSEFVSDLNTAKKIIKKYIN